MLQQFTLPFYDNRSYLLGIFDGEGCVTTGRNNQGVPRWWLSLSVGMTSREVIEMFRAEWGGGVSARTKPTAGGLILYTWAISATNAIPFLEYAVQHSVVKHRQCVIALQMARNIAKYSWAGHRKGVAFSSGKRLLTAEDQAERDRLVAELRSLQGARSRFAAIVADV
jgi:hypothetical protein